MYNVDYKHNNKIPMSKLKTLTAKLEVKKNSKIILIFIFITFFLSSSFVAIVFSSYPEFDELAYIDHVETIQKSENNWYLGDRNRMPLFNYLLFTTYTEDSNMNMQYRLFQITNIFFVLIFSYIYVSKLNKLFSSKLYFYFCVIFTLFIPVMSYVHDVVVEPLFYVTFGLFCLYVNDLLTKPNLNKYFIFGIVSSVLYLLKATGLNLFISSLFFIAFINIVKKRMHLKNVITNSIFSFLVFLFICSPYLIENYHKFNGYIFYNVNTTFYVWYDSWDDVESGTKLYGDRIGWPKMPEENIPSFNKYLNEHSNKEIINRFLQGFKSIFIYYISINEFTGAISLSIFLLFCYLQYLKKSLKSPQNFTNNNKSFDLYITFISLILFTGAAWYSVIAPIPRFTILIIIPIYFIFFKKLDNLNIYYPNRSRETDVFIILFIFLITQGVILINQI